MRITNTFGLPQTIVDAVKADPYDKGEADFSATGLLKPPRIVDLEARFSEHPDYTVDAADRLWALMGRAVHSILEEHAQGEHTVEERLYRTIVVDGNEYTISGAIDVQDGDRTLRDWKNTSVGTLMYGKQPKPEWVQQLNIYQWLVGEPRELEIVAILRDWKKSQVGNKKYPGSPVKTITIPSWTLEEAEAFVAERIRLLVDPEGPRDCTTEETWNGVRCRDWCDVAKFCPQVGGGLFV